MKDEGRRGVGGAGGWSKAQAAARVERLRLGLPADIAPRARAGAAGQMPLNTLTSRLLT